MLRSFHKNLLQVIKEIHHSTAESLPLKQKDTLEEAYIMGKLQAYEMIMQILLTQCECADCVIESVTEITCQQCLKSPERCQCG